MRAHARGEKLGLGLGLRVLGFGGPLWKGEARRRAHARWV